MYKIIHIPTKIVIAENIKTSNEAELLAAIYGCDYIAVKQ